MRFIMAVISGEMVVSNRKKAAIESDLESQGYDRIAPASAKVRPFSRPAFVDDEFDLVL